MAINNNKQSTSNSVTDANKEKDKAGTFASLVVIVDVVVLLGVLTCLWWLALCLSGSENTIKDIGPELFSEHFGRLSLVSAAFGCIIINSVYLWSKESCGACLELIESWRLKFQSLSIGLGAAMLFSMYLLNANPADSIFIPLVVVSFPFFVNSITNFIKESNSKKKSNYLENIVALIYLLVLCLMLLLAHSIIKDLNMFFFNTKQYVIDNCASHRTFCSLFLRP